MQLYTKKTIRQKWKIILVAGLCFTSFSAFSQPAENSQPNIIIILADDLGREAIGSYGGISYATPNIDQLAKNGMQFLNAHSNPLCSPTRVKLLTGKSNAANYVQFANLPQGEHTLAHMLKAVGYQTFMSGKWQLANNGGQTPEDAGFDQACIWDLRKKEKGSRYWNPRLRMLDDKLRTYAGEFGPDLINQCARELIRRSDKRPFFLYYSMLLPHNPFINPPDSHAYSDQHKFKAMVEYMDKMVGSLLAELDQQGITENTVVWFIGDNGTNTHRHSVMGDQQVIQGGKGLSTDNGTHVPFIVQWKGNIAAGSQSSQLIDLSNVLPTFADLSGQPNPLQQKYAPAITPLLEGQDISLEKNWLYLHYYPGKVKNDPRAATYAMTTEYKLYDDDRFYYLPNDLAEKNPLNPATLSALQQTVHTQLTEILNTKGVWK